MFKLNKETISNLNRISINYHKDFKSDEMFCRVENTDAVIYSCPMNYCTEKG
jgi:hypothetical protein